MGLRRAKEFVELKKAVYVMLDSKTWYFGGNVLKKLINWVIDYFSQRAMLQKEIRYHILISADICKKNYILCKKKTLLRVCNNHIAMFSKPKGKHINSASSAEEAESGRVGGYGRISGVSKRFSIACGISRNRTGELAAVESYVLEL